MNRRTLLPAVLALAGTIAVVVGIHSQLLLFRPGVTGTIETGWGGSLNHQEILLARLSLLGAAGTVLAYRWRPVALLPVAVGSAVIFASLRAASHYLFRPTADITFFLGIPPYVGVTDEIILGPQPYSLVLGGALLISAGILTWKNGRAVAGEQRLPQTTATTPRSSDE